MTPDKLTVMQELLKVAWVYVHLDPRREGVVLPDFLRQDPRVVLQYGYNMPVPIYDLKVDEQGISATLSFRRVPQPTFIPWAAVFAMTDGEQHGFIWQEDVPKELVIEREGDETQEQEGAAPQPPAQAAPQPPAQAAPQPPAPGKRPILSSVPMPPPDETTDDKSAAPSQGMSASAGATSGPGKTKKPRPSHLKLVD
jgi:hypothetical protein